MTEHKGGSKIEIVSGTVENNSGPHKPRLYVDEIELIRPETIAQAEKMEDVRPNERGLVDEG